MSRILITGGAGFIGSHLAETLLEQGHDVTCMDDFSTGSRENIEHLANLTVIEQDVNAPDAFTGFSVPFDAVFHYAATVGVRRTNENPSRVMDDVAGLRALAAFAKEGGTKKIIFASSSEVYGEPSTVPTNEKDGSIAWSPYTTVKMYGEHLMHTLWTEHGVPAVSLRFFNVYGPRQIGSGYGFVTATFVKQVLQGQQPTIYGDGSQTRDFVHISDNVQTAIAAMNSTKANGHVMNVGTGIQTSIQELAMTIIRSAQHKDVREPTYLPARDIEIMRRCASTDAMHRLLEIQCNISIEEGITELVQAEKQEISKTQTTQKMYSHALGQSVVR